MRMSFLVAVFAAVSCASELFGAGVAVEIDV